MSRHTDDPRITAFGADGYTVTGDDGTARHVLPTGIFGWTVCEGPNLDFVPTTDGGFAIGFPTADHAIDALLGVTPDPADQPAPAADPPAPAPAADDDYVDGA